MKTSNINIRVSDEEKKQMQQEANKQNRSVSNFIVWIFKQFKGKGA